MLSLKFEMTHGKHVLLPIEGTTFEQVTDSMRKDRVIAFRNGDNWHLKGTLDEVIATINAEMRKIQLEQMQQARLAAVGPMSFKG